MPIEAMPINMTRRTALIAVPALLAPPVRAQPSSTSSPNPETFEFAELEKPAVFDIASISGSLKETIQKGQELIWRRKQRPADRTFQVTNISVGVIRSQISGQVTMTVSGNISSLGYRTSERAKLHLIIRSKGGAALHVSTFDISVECTDTVQTLHLDTQEVPTTLAPAVFANAASIEVADHIEPNFPGVRVQRCSS